MSDTGEKTVAKRLWSAEEKLLIADYILYKIGQLDNKLAHYRAIPPAQRTKGDRKLLAVTQQQRAALVWALPGGKGFTGLPAKG